MEPLIDVLAQLSDNERNDFTSWFSSLSKKERDSVASVLARTSIERLRVVLSVPEEQRISLFLVPYNASEELDNRIKQSGIHDDLKAIRKGLLNGIRDNLSKINEKKRK